MAVTLVKCCNTVAERHGSALRVNLSASMAVLCLSAIAPCIALPPASLQSLARVPAIPCEACLALNADKLTVYGNIMLKEY